MPVEKLGITGVVFTDQRDFYPNPDEVMRINPNVSPFLTDLLRLPIKRVTDADYKMFEKDPTWRNQEFLVNDATPPAWSNPGAGVGTPDATATITVDGPVGIKIDASLIGAEVSIWNSAGTTYRGNAYVQAVNSATEVVLKVISNPQVQNQAVATLVNNDVLQVEGTSHGEVSESPDSYAGVPRVVYNSLEVQRTSFQVSFDKIQAALRGVEGENALSELRTDKRDEHMIRFQRKLLHGVRPGGIGGVAKGAGGLPDTTFIDHIEDASGDTVRKTMGAITAMFRYGSTSGNDQNVFDTALATYEYSNFVDDYDKAMQFDHSSGVRRAYCGPAAYNFWSKLQNTAGVFTGWTINVEPTKEDTIGMHTRRVIMPSGPDLELVKMQDWRGRRTGYMFLPDPRYIGLAQYPQSPDGPPVSPASYHSNIKKDNRPRYQKDEFETQMGLWLGQMQGHSLWRFT